MANKGFIKDWLGNQILPITRGELVLDQYGIMAFNSDQFLAGDGHPGLVTAAERAMLSGGGSGGGIQDIYSKLDYINQGFKVKGNPLHFYTTEGTLTPTPINLISDGENRIEITIADNVINFGLASITLEGTSASGILKSIVVDKFGRVTSVSGSALTNAEIPEELSDKSIKNSTLDGCTTENEEIGNNNKAIVNKAYVDSRIQEITGLATGALKFGGPISTADAALTVITEENGQKYKNHYFKVTGNYTIESDYIFVESGETAFNVSAKIGDTLIVYPVSSNESKFVHIPSGDDITTITVKEEGAASEALYERMGNITFQFSPLFEIANPQGTGIAQISIPQASNSNDGYLSKTDYATFSSYASSLKVTYDSSVAEGVGAYQIGTLTVGTTPYTIYGKNSITSLTVNDGSNEDKYNPILKFTETGQIDLDIAFKGVGGITVQRNGDSIEFLAGNVVLDQEVPQINNPRTAKYLTIYNGYQFGVQLGSIDSDGNVTDGLTDFSQFNALVSKVSLTTVFEDISYSLNGEENIAEYRYGNQKLINAVTITI